MINKEDIELIVNGWRLKLSALFIQWAINLVPYEQTKSRLKEGIQLSYHLIQKDLTSDES